MTTQNPWLGLKSYEESDRLYGRQKESDELSNIIINSFHTIIYGKSGIGKTSLLRAGVFPTLRYEDFMPIYIRLEHKENAEEDYYLRQIEEVVGGADDNCGETHGCASLQDIHGASLHTIFSSIKSIKSRGIGLTPVFVFDQFEEIFTLNENHSSEAVTRFFSDLSDILNNDDNNQDYRIVICLREDYLYYIERLSESIPAFKRNRYCLQDLTRDEALEVITQPQKDLVTTTVADEILRKLSPDNANEVNATILSLYMSQLYDKMVKSSATTISSSLIQQFGDDIISTFYFSSIEGITEKSIEYLEDHLVTTGGYRHNIPLEDALSNGIKQSEINCLKDLRILNIQPRQGNILYMEYTHDVLCPIIVSNREQRTLRKKAKRQKKIIAAWVISILFMAGITTSFILQNRKISQKQESMLLMQSRAIAGQAEQLFQNGDHTKAIALCLKALPEDLSNPDRPISYEALQTLASFYYSNYESCKRIIKDGENIVSATFSPDNKYLVTTSEEGNIKMWNVSSGKLVRICKGHTGRVFEASFSPDGKYFTTCSEDSTARIWNTETGKLLKVLKGHKSIVTYSVFSPDGSLIVTTSNDSTARIWNAESGKCLRILSGHKGNVYKPSFSPDGRFLVTSSSDLTARVWDVNTGKLVKLLREEQVQPPALYSPDGKLIAVANKHNVRLLDATNFEFVKELESPEGTYYNIHQIKFSSDSKYIGILGGAFVWDISSGKMVFGNEIDDSEDSFVYYMSFNFNPEGKQIILTKVDSTAIIMDLATGEQIKVLSGQGELCNSAIFSPNGRYVATLGRRGSVMISDLSIKERTKAMESSYLSLKSKIVKSNNDDLYCASFAGDSINIYNITKDRIVKGFCIEENKILSTLSPDLKCVIPYNYEDSTIQVLNAENGAVVSVINGHFNKLVSVSFTPDSRYVVTTSRDSAATMWNVLTGKKVQVFKGHTNIVKSVAFSQDMRYLITSSSDSTARIWNITNGKLVRTLKGHTGYVNYATYSPDGKHIVTTSNDSTIRMWNASTGTLVRVFRGHEDCVVTAAFSPEGKYLISASQPSGSLKNTIRIWNVATGQTIQILDHFETTFFSFSKDGRDIISLSQYMKTKKIWHFREPQELIDHFRKIVGDYQFTPEEEIKYYLK